MADKPSNILGDFEYNARKFWKFVASSLNEAPNRHRLNMAAGFAVFAYLGNEIAKVIFATDNDGFKIKKEDVILPMRPLYGIAPCNPYSDDTHDRVVNILRKMTPAITGAMGAIAGSEWHFRPFDKKFDETYSKALEKGELNFKLADEKLMRSRGRMWRNGAAVAANLGSASGLGPIYGLLLGLTFVCRNQNTMGNHIPFIGRMLNAHGSEHLRPHGKINKMVSHIVNNEPANIDHKYLQDTAEDVLASWMKRTDARKVRSMVERELDEIVKDVQSGKYTAEDVKKNIGANVNKIFSAGKLNELGVKPEDINIGDMGFATDFLRLFGHGRIEREVKADLMKSGASVS